MTPADNQGQSAFRCNRCGSEMFTQAHRYSAVCSGAFLPLINGVKSIIRCIGCGRMFATRTDGTQPPYMEVGE